MRRRWSGWDTGCDEGGRELRGVGRVSIVVLDLIEVVLNGLMVDVLYAPVALGFVLIFKASGIFSYAQGVMALFAALTLVGLQSGQVPFAHLINVVFGTDIHSFGWTLPAVVAIALAIGVMILLAVCVERFLLRRLVNQEPIILFMATIGLAYFLKGFGNLMWGSDIKAVEIGIPKGGSLWWEEVTAGWAAADSGYWGMYVDKLDVTATVIAGLLVAGLTLFSQFIKTGRALRAVADDDQAALSVGISLRAIWVITWSIAGVVRAGVSRSVRCAAIAGASGGWRDARALRRAGDADPGGARGGPGGGAARG